MIFSFARILASVSGVSFVISLIIETWRPGFISFYWNPQWLILAFILGILVAIFDKEKPIKGYPQAIRLLLAIIVALGIYHLFPVSGTGWIVSIGAFLLVLAATGK